MKDRRPSVGLPVWFLVAIILVAAIWCWILGRMHLSGAASPLDPVETVLADWRLHYAGQRPASERIAIVAIDDATVALEGYPLDRGRIADLVEAIRRNGASAVALDMLFLDPSRQETDGRLAEALSSLPSVIAAAGRFAQGPAQRGLARAEAIDGPIEPLTAAAAVGLVNISIDAGGTPRHIPLLAAAPSGLVPSFVLAAAARSGRQVKIIADGLALDGEPRFMDLGYNLPIRYLGPSRTIPTVSAGDLLAGRPIGVTLQGKVVVIGATATAIGDRFSTPFDSVLPGAEILATGIGQLLDGTYLRRDMGIRTLDVAVMAALTITGLLAVTFLSHATGLAVFAAIVAGSMAGVTLAFAQDVWMSAALPLAAAVPVVAIVSLGRLVFDRRHANRLASENDALGRFQPRAITRRIAEDPAFLAEPQVIDAPVLFVDLSGYTGLSEALGVLGTRGFLKSFHDLVVDVVERNGGVVITFMGDGAMIGFGIPDVSDDDAARAVSTAFDLVEAIDEWAAGAVPDGASPRLRVGGHFGPVVLSRLGHDRHQHIAMTGDTTNTASRLMDVAKQNSALIALSRRLVDQAGSAREAMAAPDLLLTTPIRGRQAELEVALWRPAGLPASEGG